MDTTHKQEYRIRDLPTKSVTLFPTRAQIVREIKDVALKVRHNSPVSWKIIANHPLSQAQTRSLSWD